MTDLCSSLDMLADPELLNECKETAFLAFRSKYTGLFCMALKDAARPRNQVRGELQGLIKSLRAELGPIEDPEEAKLPPTRLFSEVLRKRIAAGFKF